MCYSEFNDLMAHIVRLDADVLSIEASRSDMEVPARSTTRMRSDWGVYDIHSRVPSIDEIERLLELAEERIGRNRLWTNPGCGLKTRRWEEVLPALDHMLQATQRRRAATTVSIAVGSIERVPPRVTTACLTRTRLEKLGP